MKRMVNFLPSISTLAQPVSRFIFKNFDFEVLNFRKLLFASFITIYSAKRKQILLWKRSAGSRAEHNNTAGGLRLNPALKDLWPFALYQKYSIFRKLHLIEQMYAAFIHSIIQRRGSKHCYRREALAPMLSITTPRVMCDSTQPEEKGSHWPFYQH